MTRPFILATACALVIAACFSVGARAAALSADELRLLQNAKPTNQEITQASELAKKLGGEASLEGLEIILQTGERYRLGDYAYGFTYAGAALSPELEALMVRQFAAGDNRYAFIRMIGEGRTKYQSRAMFDALLAALDKGLEDAQFAFGRAQSMMQAIVKTDLPGIEAPLLERLPALPRSPAMGSAPPWSWSGYGIAIQFLARRKYAPAAAFLSERLQQAAPEAEPQKSEAALVLAALGAIDPQEGARAASVRLERLSHATYDFAVESEMQRTLGFLGRQGVLLPAEKLAALLKGKNPNDRLAASVIQALIRTPQKQAIDIVIDRLAWAGAQTSPPPLEVEHTLAGLAGLKDQTLLDYVRLRKALPAGLSERAVSAHLKLIERRQEAQAVPDVIAYLPGPQGTEALRLIVESDSVEVWRRARAGLEALQREQKIDPPRYGYVRARLDELIADPDKHFAAKKQRQLAQAYEEDKRKVDSLRRDPERWIAAAEDLELKYAALPGASAMLAAEIRTAYWRLAADTRFVRKQPAQAIALYEKALRKGSSETWRFRGFLTEVLIADIYQFDLRAPRKALERYEKALAQLAAAQAQGGPMEAGVAAPWLRFLQHEIAYLRTGAKFGGTLTKEDVLGFLGAAFLLDSSGAFTRRAADPVRLESLPPSRLHLPSTTATLFEPAEPDSILRYLDRNDPSGYWSACMLGVVPYLDGVLKRNRDGKMAEQIQAMLPALRADAPQSAALRRASDRFLKERKVSLYLPAPDLRKSSPESTWNLFMDSLKQGDLEAAYACLTPKMKQKIEPAFSSMPKQALKDMAGSFSAFAISEKTGEIREAVVSRGNRAGFVYFLELDGEWKIDEM